MFALPKPPPTALRLCGQEYRLARVFKHDFWAATCLYVADSPASPQPDAFEKVAVKFGREQDFCGLPLAWVGEFLADREQAIYQALAGVEGVPRWAGRLGPSTYAIEYIDARPLDHLQAPPQGFFDSLRGLLEAIHARGVAYGDANKRSNILVGDRGRPYLVDFQLAIRRRDELPWPIGAALRKVVAYLAAKDIYHLCKHKRRLCPQELTGEEEKLSRRRTGLHLLHRKLTKPYRAIRRRFLTAQYQKGRLVSPTADLEDHYMPEKATWQFERKPEAQRGHRDEGDGS